MPHKYKSLSIVIPAYNEEVLIEACLRAIEAQTMRPQQVIVVDNNSSDRTVAIAQSFPFVTVVHARQQGIVYARNAGFDAATSDIIGRIDADVTIPPGWVHYVKRFYEDSDHYNVGLSGNGRPNNLRFARFLGWVQGQIAFRTNRLLLGHYIFFGSNMAIPSHVWQAVRHQICERTDIHEDLDLAIHTHRAGYRIAYRESLRVYGRVGRVISNRHNLMANLMMWPQTLKVHSINSWVFGWLGAVLLYAASPIPLLFERIARIAGRKPYA